MTQHFYGDMSNLNAPYRMASIQGLGAVTWEGRTLPSAGYPWMQESDDTLQVQYRFNEALAQKDLCPLLLDGVAGPRTCGALYSVDTPAPSGLVQTCSLHAGEEMAPKSCPGGVVPDSPAPVVDDEVVVEKRGGIPIWIWGLGLGVLAVGAAIAMKKKKRR